METKKTIRILIAKIGLDGHDVGAKVLIFWLRDQGMEVIYTGLRQSVEQVVEVALQEAVDVIGVSILSGSHVSIAKKLLKRIHERELDDVLVLFGGTIPKDDIAVLKGAGVHGVFPSHAKLEEISAFIKENVKQAGKKGDSSRFLQQTIGSCPPFFQGIAERIRHRESMDKIMTAEEAALLFRDGMLVATSGSTMGFPKATFGALAERIKAEGGIKIDLLCAGPLSSEFEDLLFEAGGIRRRIGAVGGEKLRGGINRGEVMFIEGKGSSLPLQVKRGWFGPLDMAVIEAVGLTETGQIIPSTAVYDAPEWIATASQVIVEINLNRPLSLEGLHDIYPRGDDPIPVVGNGNPLRRIGVPYFPVDPGKIKGIVISDMGDKPSEEAKPDAMGAAIGQHLVDFFRKEVVAGRLSESLPPFELGFGELFGSMMKKIGEGGFKNFRFHLPMVTDPVFELVEAGRVEWVEAIALRLSSDAWKRFEQEPDRYKKVIVLRPFTVINSAELIQRMGVTAINGCLEMDLQGQVNSSHLLGARIMAGIGGTYDYARNSPCSIFIARSTTKGGKISTIVPLVSHVDHTEHDVDILVTEQGLADLRGLDPRERAWEIIRKCAHPDYKELLSDYLARAEKEPGHIPVLPEESGSFHSRFKRSGSMREGGS